MLDIFESIYQHPLFKENDLQIIAQAHKKVELPKGSYIFKEGETANEYYLLEKGIVRAFVLDYNNNEITTELFTDNEIVIVPASLFQRQPSQETVQTITDCVLWKIDFQDFQNLFTSYPGFSEWGRLWFTFQLFSLKQKSLDIVTQTASNRYLKLLKDKPQLVQNTPLKHIASYLGITDTSLSRIRKEVLKI
jgi:CRP-like cAMP-binding protein